MGYHRAGFEVVGVDIEPQPHYPFRFVQADALDYPLHCADVVHASPPCQAFTVYNNCRPGHSPKWPDLISQTRDHLVRSGLPYIMENVAGAPLADPIRLCGTSFGLRVRRHRFFEVRGFSAVPPPCDHGRYQDRLFPGSSNRPNGRTVANIGEYRVPLAQQKLAMGINWQVTLAELSQAIPPAYTEWIGPAAASLIYMPPRRTH